MARRATNWWLRSPYTNYEVGVWFCYSSGSCSGWGAYGSYGVRPALMG